MAVFRVEKNGNYTVMSNHHLRSTTLSLKAKGLLSLMLSLPEDWDYTLKGLAFINKEGVDSIRAAVRELEGEGYLRRVKVRNARGQFEDCEYIISEMPYKEQYDSVDNSNENSTTVDNSRSILSEPVTEELKSDEPVSEKPVSDNTTQINKDKQNKELLNTDINKYRSINQVTDGTDLFAKTAIQIKKQIGYDRLVEEGNRYIIDDIVKVMADITVNDYEHCSINGMNIPGEWVRNRYRLITHERVKELLPELEAAHSRVRRMKPYIRTALYNCFFR